MLQYKVQTQSEYTEHVKAEGKKEEKEESVVSSADTIIDPWTVMVERLKTQMALPIFNKN